MGDDAATLQRVAAARRRRIVIAAQTPAAAVSHRVRLGGTRWSVWQDVALRGAGFPADMVLAICDEPLARSADLAAADPAGPGPAYDAVYAGATRPGMAELLHDAGVGVARRSKDRQREFVIASYLQRYCLKNDTIGVFGPVGWACVAPGTAGLVVTPGEHLIARRTTYFEVWAIDKVAAEIARQGRVLGWLRPRRTRSAFLAGNVLHRPHRQPVALTDAELRILLACDGSATISDVLASAGLPDARALLTRPGSSRRWRAWRQRSSRSPGRLLPGGRARATPAGP